MTALGTVVAASPLNANDASRYTGFTATADITETASFALGNTPSDFGNMNSLSWTYDGRESINGGDDSEEVLVRIVNGGTILAAATSGGTFQRIYIKSAGGFSTTDTTRGPTAFSYVNTTANKTTWDGATVEIRRINVKTKGADNVRPEPDYFAVTGDYTAGSGAQSLTPSTLSVSPSFPTASIAVESTYTLVQETTASQFDMSTSDLTITFPQQATEGNLLVVTAFHRPGGTPPIPTGWSEAIKVEDATNADWLQILYKESDGTETSVDIGVDGGGGVTDGVTAWFGEYSGFSGTPTLDQTSSNGPVDATSVSTGTTATLADANQIAIAGFSGRTFGTLNTESFDSYTNSFTEEGEVSAGNAASNWSLHAAATKETASTSGVETTATASASGRLMAVLATFYGGTSTQDITASLHSVSVSFPTATLTSVATLAANLLSITPSFPTAEISESVTLQANLLSITPNFPTATLVQEQFLQSLLVSVSPSFPTATIFTDQFLQPSTLGITTTFLQATIAGEEVFITPSLLSITPTFPTASIDSVASLLANTLNLTPSFPGASLDTDYTIFADLLSVSPSFPQASIQIHSFLEASLLSITATFSQATVTPGTATISASVHSITPTFPSAEASSEAPEGTIEGGVLQPVVSFGTATVSATVELLPATLGLSPQFPQSDLAATADLDAPSISLVASFGTSLIEVENILFGNLLSIVAVFPTALAGVGSGTPLTPIDTEGQGIAQEMAAARGFSGDLDWLGSINALAGINGREKLGALVAMGATPGADLLLALEQLAFDGQGPADFNTLMRRWAESGNF